MAHEIAALVQHYLGEWDSAEWADAYHSLVELGPPILPELELCFGETHDRRLRAALIQVASRMRNDAALPLLQIALRDEADNVWKQALDGLVDLASPAAIAVLEGALEQPAPGRIEATEWIGWVREALLQARSVGEARAAADT